MSITFEQAKALRPGDVLHSEAHVDADGSCSEWKVNGRVTVWRTRPQEVRVPVKYGLRSYDYVTNRDLDLVHLAEECPWVRFRCLVEGEVFEFRRAPGMAVGPWEKTGPRLYARVGWENRPQSEIGQSGMFGVGSINAWVRRVKE